MTDLKDQERLNELAKQWGEQAKPAMFDKFTPADLRLLLERFAPLQQLIHKIATDDAPVVSNLAHTPAEEQPPANNAEVTRLQQKIAALNTELETLQQQSAQDKQQLVQAAEAQKAQNQQLQQYADSKAQHEQQLAQLGYELKQLTASHKQTQKQLVNCEQQLQQEKDAANRYQQQASQLEQEVASLGKQLAQFQPPAQLQILRSDTELTRSLGLDLTGNDQQALIAMVAVLAQKDNLERLWDSLRERCDAEKRAASAQEQALLTAALSWYNHNWKSRPFQLLEPATGTGFNFEQHQKAKHQTDGETIKQVWLPGLADGAGKPLRKSLVLTH